MMAGATQDEEFMDDMICRFFLVNLIPGLHLKS